MGYAEHNLISGEQITFRGRVHWTALVTSVVPAMALIILAIAVVIGAFSWDHSYRTLLLIAAAVIFLASSVVVLVGTMKRRAAEFVVTNKRIIAKVGIVEKQTAEIFLNKVESIGVDQNLRGRMMGYGTVTVRGTGGSIESFNRIADPFEFRRQIQEQIGHINEPALAK